MLSPICSLRLEVQILEPAVLEEEDKGRGALSCLEATPVRIERQRALGRVRAEGRKQKPGKLEIRKLGPWTQGSSQAGTKLTRLPWGLEFHILRLAQVSDPFVWTQTHSPSLSLEKCAQAQTHHRQPSTLLHKG